MKFKGKKALGPKPEYIVIPRGEENIVFIAKPILDYSGFEDLCPRPVPPGILYPDGRRGQDIESAEFRTQLTDYVQMRTDWYIVNSLRDTPFIEWEKVEYNKPETWKFWKDELQEFLTEREVHQIMEAISVANGLDQAKIEEAKQRFLAGMANPLNDQSSQVTEPSITPSGEPASV